MFDEEILKTLLNNTPIGYAYLDVEEGDAGLTFSFADMNPSFTKITEIDKKVIGKSLEEIGGHYHLIQEISALLEAVVSLGDDAAVLRCINPLGKCLYMHGIAAKPHGLIVQIIDKTEEELLKNALTKRADELQYISYHDKLTGLYNRAFFEEEMKRLDNERNLPISIIMGDTNGLKLINDVFGHEAGDKMIISTANILTQSCRKDDIIARWGGDEFIILLPKTPSKMALEIINRIKSKFKTEKFDMDYLNISLGYSVKKDPSIPLTETLKEAENNMYKNKSIEGIKVRKLIVSSMINYLYDGNIEVKQHMERLKTYTSKLGKELNLPTEEVDKLNILCEVHDIGNVSVSKNALSKPGVLTEDDWMEIKKHPEVGFRIAKSIPELSDIANYILHHHERWDGHGYPHKLKGEEIPLLSRIFTIVDVYDAMTQDKTYRKAYPKECVLKYIKDHAGLRFDPKIVEIFLQVVG